MQQVLRNYVLRRFMSNRCILIIVPCYCAFLAHLRFVMFSLTFSSNKIEVFKLL